MNCYVKFAVVVSGAGAEDRFEGLLEAVGAYARHRGAMQVVAGVNAGRRAAYERMLSTGFGLWRTGIAMHRPNGAGFQPSGGVCHRRLALIFFEDNVDLLKSFGIEGLDIFPLFHIASHLLESAFVDAHDGRQAIGDPHRLHRVR